MSRASRKAKADRTAEIISEQLDFEELLEPYREGGRSAEHPTRRTIGTITDYLLHKKKYPKEVVGAALLAVFLELKAGKVFEGDGTYGSPGRQFVTYIRHTCDTLNRRRLEDEATIWVQEMFKVFQESQKRTFRVKLDNWLHTGHWR